MGDKLKGKDFVLFMERDSAMIPVCCSRELTISITSELIEATKAPQSRWKSYIYGDCGYTLSASGLVIIDDSFTINDFYNAITTQKRLAFVSQSNAEHDVFFSGAVLLTNIEIAGSYKDVMTYSIQATGDGILSNVNPYEINIITDGNGHPLEDGNGNIISVQEHGDLLPINLNINC